MKVIHRVSFHPKHHLKVKRRFLKLGIKLKELFMHGNPKYSLGCQFDISEDDPLWLRVSKIIKKNKILTVPRVEFTEDEVLSAEWVLLNPIYFADNGFPMPHLDGSWRNISFNAGKECPCCGIGIDQTAPIHLKSEPNLRDNDFISIFWTYSIFARLKVFEILKQREIKGFEPMPVILHKLGTPLKTIKQIRILEEHRPCIMDDNLVRDNTSCGHTKYHVLNREMIKFSRDTFSNMPDLIRTHEWFGTGGEAFQLVLASAKFVQVYMENNWKGLTLIPIELV